MKDVELIRGDCLKVLPTLEAGSVHCCITSPPYFNLRDYQIPGQFGLEATPDAYVANLVAVFREVRRVLRDDGTVWLNLGDSFAGGSMDGGPRSSSTLAGTHHEDRKGCRFRGERVTPGLPAKNLIGIPWRVAFALQADGWILRSDIIWHKPNPMPESVRDRPTKSHEYIFLLAKQGRYFYDGDAIKEPAKEPGRRKVTRTKSGSYAQAIANGQSPHGNGKLGAVMVCPEMANKRSVWVVPTHPLKEAHFATFPPKLITPCVLAGCPEGGTILDPFAGACTTGLVAVQHGRKFIGIDLNPAYLKIGRKRIEESPTLQAA